MSDAKITWKPGRVKLGDLKGWGDNPRQISKTAAKKLERSILELGQVETLAISEDNELYDGHQRLAVLLKKYGKDHEIDVRISSRKLTDEERRKLVLYLHTATGSWDWDSLAGWDTDKLKGWGFDQETLTEWNLDSVNLREFLSGTSENHSSLEDLEREYTSSDSSKDFNPFIKIQVSQQTKNLFEKKLKEASGATDEERLLDILKRSKK